MGISIIGSSNVTIYVANDTDLIEENYEKNYDNIIHYYYQNNLMIVKSENTKQIKASRSYSGCVECIRNIASYASKHGIQFYMIPILCEGCVFSNKETIKSENSLKQIVEILDEDEIECVSNLNLDPWDIEFINLLYKAFKLCNERGVIVFC
tara:strand:- start:5495 stop:5950 length:456 start_codon:yes stop_codon:yes gene_type:complete